MTPARLLVAGLLMLVAAPESAATFTLPVQGDVFTIASP